MNQYLSHRLRNENGASAVEFALVAPLLILLVFGAIQFGRLYNNYIAVTHAAREGARLAAVGKYDEGTVRQRAYPVAPSSVSLSYPEGVGHGNPVQVIVEYVYTLSIPFMGDRNIPLTGISSMMQEM